MIKEKNNIPASLKIAHIVVDDKFTDSAYDQFETVAPEQNTYYLITNNVNLTYIEKTKIVKIPNNKYLDSQFIKHISRYNIIVFHSLTKFNQEISIHLKKYPIIKIWIGMGYDYYDLIYKDISKLHLPATLKIFPQGKTNEDITQSIKQAEYLKKKAISTIDLFAPVLPNEYAMVCDVFPQKFRFPQYASWNYSKSSSIFNNDLQINKQSNNTLLGNSATPTNNHLDAIISFSKHFSRGKKIVSPLSYGDYIYAKLFILHAKKILGNNFYALTKLLSYNQYADIISNCNTVIMNHIRQQASGTVFSAIHMGATIFLREENPLYKSCRDRQLTVFSVQDLEKDNKLFEYKLTDSEIKKNKHILHNLYSFEEAIRKTKSLILQAINNNSSVKFSTKNINNSAKSLTAPEKEKIFCISTQRTGTTSVGDFLVDHGFRVAREHHGVENNWNYLCDAGDYDSIFNSLAFRSFQAFEDSPWWWPHLYRILFHKFPTSKFILFLRNSDKWFDSMMSLKNGKILGNTERHCRLYRRLHEFYNKLDQDPHFKPTINDKDQLMSLKGMRTHYINIYNELNREKIEFFKRHARNRLFICELEDNKKWLKLGNFLNVDVSHDYDVHSNKSKKGSSSIDVELTDLNQSG
jgi:hypothetical protein